MITAEIPVHEALDPETYEKICAYAETTDCPPLIAENIRAGTFTYNRNTSEIKIYLMGKLAAEMRGHAGPGPLQLP